MAPDLLRHPCPGFARTTWPPRTCRPAPRGIFFSHGDAGPRVSSAVSDDRRRSCAPNQRRGDPGWARRTPRFPWLSDPAGAVCAGAHRAFQRRPVALPPAQPGLPASSGCTSNGDRVRFEAFSGCCGVYARMDVLEGGLDGDILGRGTTNVDINPPLRVYTVRGNGAASLPVTSRTGRLVGVQGPNGLARVEIGPGGPISPVLGSGRRRKLLAGRAPRRPGCSRSRVRFLGQRPAFVRFP